MAERIGRDRTHDRLEPQGPPAPMPLPRRPVRRSSRGDGELVYAIGDVHGRYDLLTKLLALIADDARESAGERRALLILLGDYVDRGPDTAKVLSALAWLRQRSDFELHLLKGNHEAVMLGYLDDPAAAGKWLRFGGDATMRSYGVDPPDADDPIEAQLLARDALLDRMPAAHLRLLERLELSVQVGDYAFVHAGVRPGVPLDRQIETDLLWIREGFLDRDHRFEKIVVHGHSWTSDEPAKRAHRIGIDTGAYETGVLTALRLEDDSQDFIQATI